MSAPVNDTMVSSPKPKSNHFWGRFRLKNGDWHWMSARADGEPYNYLTLQSASDSIARTVSMDGCIEGEVYDDQGNRVEQWVAKPYHCKAGRVAAVCDPASGEPGASQEVG
jgi:hypothetical protein